VCINQIIILIVQLHNSLQQDVIKANTATWFKRALDKSWFI